LACALNEHLDIEDACNLPQNPGQGEGESRERWGVQELLDGSPKNVYKIILGLNLKG